MDKLRQYLKTLPIDERAIFAERCLTTIGYMRKALSTGQLLREKICALIEKESCGAVTREDLRPDDWQTIWPELAQAASTATAGQGA